MAAALRSEWPSTLSSTKTVRPSPSLRAVEHRAVAGDRRRRARARAGGAGRARGRGAAARPARRWRSGPRAAGSRAAAGRRCPGACSSPHSTVRGRSLRRSTVRGAEVSTKWPWICGTLPPCSRRAPPPRCTSAPCSGPACCFLPALAAEVAGPASVLAWVGLLALSAPLAIDVRRARRPPARGRRHGRLRARRVRRARRRGDRLVVPDRRDARRARRGADRRLLRGRAARRRPRGRGRRRGRDDRGRDRRQRGRPAHHRAAPARPRRAARGAAAGRRRHRAAREPRRATGRRSRRTAGPRSAARRAC